MADEPQGPDPEGAPADRDSAGRFLPGNSLWAAANELAGRKRKFETPRELLAAANEYFAWIRHNHLYRDDVGWFQGRPRHESVALVRTALIVDLCLFLGISRSTWYDWKTNRSDLAEAIEMIEMGIESDQTQNALTGQANGHVVTRVLGLAEKTEFSGVVVNISGRDADL